jgi:uncharacterized protein YyaL (SSP411 family)
MARAALALFEATGEPGFLDRAERWTMAADRHYWDADAGGYFLAADDTDDLITRTKSALDNAVASGNGTMAGVLARLYFLTGNDAYRARAERLVTTFTGDLDRTALGLATLLNGYELLQAAVQIVVVGEPAAAETRAFLGTVHGLSLPNKVLSVIAPDQALPAGHPAAGKGRVDGRATAYVCRGTTCTMPIVEPKALAAELAADG